MANGYNPYNIAGTQTGIIENLIKSQQTIRDQDIALGIQKKEMTDEFEDKLAEAQKKQEAALAKKRKKDPFAKALGIASMFLPGIGPAIAGGLLGMADVKDQEKFAKGQIAKARQLGLDTDLFEGTFLGKGAKQAQRESDRLLDSLYEQADVSGMDLLTTGIMSGIEGKAMGDLVGNITSAFKPQMGVEKIGEQLTSGGFEPLSKQLGGYQSSALGEGFAGIATREGALAPTISKLQSTVIPDSRNFLDKLLEGLGDFDITQSLGDNTKGIPATQNILTLLQYLQ
jgi:hypothetical protein